MSKPNLCPHCERPMEFRRRALNKRMAHTLLRLLQFDRAFPGDYLHVPSLEGDNHEVSQLKPWGLIEERPESKEDGNPHAGYWRITERGRQFALGRSREPSHYFGFNTRNQPPVLDSSKMITIREVRNFNYDELIMGW